MISLTQQQRKLVQLHQALHQHDRRGSVPKRWLCIST